MSPHALETAGLAEAEAESILLACPLFSSFTSAEISSLAVTAELMDAAQGRVLFHQGERGEDLFLIVSGSVRLSASAADGREHPVALLGPRSCFGEMALLDGEPRAATAIAARPSRFVRVTSAGLESVFREHPQARGTFVREGLRLVSSRLRSANERYWSQAASSFKAKAEAAQSRSRLLSLVSHEFRTPLTVIKCNAQLLRRSEPAPRASLVQKILLHSERLEVLLDDLITLALLQAGSRMSEMTEFDLGETAAEVVAEMAKAAEAKGLRLRLRANPESEATLVGDRVLIRRATRHLVDNAVRFSSAPGEILVETEALPNGCVRLKVRDQGEGIDPESFGRLIESFVQQQDPLNRDAEGLGIGLALVNEVAKAHGGSLMVESALAKGSCFTIELAQVPEPRPVSASEERKVQGE
jgi:signal transduction histidine kinase